MTTTGAEPLFLDTNILVYATDRDSPLQSVAAGALQDARSAGVLLVVSPQVLREYLAVALRPAAAGGASLDDVRANIATFREAFQVVAETDAVVERLVGLLPRLPVGRRRVHDANIVATMLTHGVRQLLTHNTVDFAPFADLITVVPLVSLPPPSGPDAG